MALMELMPLVCNTNLLPQAKWVLTVLIVDRLIIRLAAFLFAGLNNHPQLWHSWSQGGSL